MGRARKKKQPSGIKLQLVLIIVGLLLFVTLLFASFWSWHKIYLQHQTIKKLTLAVERYKAQQLSPTPVSYISISVTPTPLPSKTTTLPHENLPGFDMKFLPHWMVFMKQFRDRDSHGFDNTYTPICAENCMGIRISQAAVMLELIFDEAYDSNGMKCSNSVGVTPIGNEWYRIKTHDGYLYAWKPQRDVTITSENAPGYFFGKKTDEWSLMNDTRYKLCLSGAGYFLSEHSPVYPGVDGNGIPLLLEFPKITGSPSAVQLKQLDDMIASITGFWTPS